MATFPTPAFTKVIADLAAAAAQTTVPVLMETGQIALVAAFLASM